MKLYYVDDVVYLLIHNLPRQVSGLKQANSAVLVVIRIRYDICYSLLNLLKSPSALLRCCVGTVISCT